MITTISVYTENMSKEELMTFGHELISKLSEIKRVESIHIIDVEPDAEKEDR
jgi:hypothetical protein